MRCVVVFSFRTTTNGTTQRCVDCSCSCYSAHVQFTMVLGFSCSGGSFQLAAAPSLVLSLRVGVFGCWVGVWQGWQRVPGHDKCLTWECGFGWICSTGVLVGLCHSLHVVRLSLSAVCSAACTAWALAVFDCAALPGHVLACNLSTQMVLNGHWISLCVSRQLV